MRKYYILIVMIFAVMSFSCDSGDDKDTENGESIYRNPVSGSQSTFTCDTCHALEEGIGFRRPGHPIGNATRRASYKNEQLDSMLAAVNICLTEWMNAGSWTEDNPQWLSLFSWLDEQATVEEAELVIMKIADPPSGLNGGDADLGRQIFNTSCAVCHGIDGEGSNKAPMIGGIGFGDNATITPEIAAERIRKSGRIDSNVYEGLTGGIMPFWGENRLSDDELINIIAFLSLTDNETEIDDDGEDDEPEDDLECQSTHPKIGMEATLSTFSHGVEGTAVIKDDCTIVLNNFSYDGGGIVVEVYAGKGGNYLQPQGFSLSENIKGRRFENESFTVKIPEGKTLDDLDGISIWCVDVGVSFGDGLFK